MTRDKEQLLIILLQISPHKGFTIDQCKFVVGTFIKVSNSQIIKGNYSSTHSALEYFEKWHLKINKKSALNGHTSKTRTNPDSKHFLHSLTPHGCMTGGSVSCNPQSCFQLLAGLKGLMFKIFRSFLLTIVFCCLKKI